MPDKNSKIHNNSYDMPNTESPQSNETTEQADPSTLSPEQTEKSSVEVIQELLKQENFDPSQYYNVLSSYVKSRASSLGVDKPVNLFLKYSYMQENQNGSSLQCLRLNPTSQEPFKGNWGWLTRAFHSSEGTFLDFPAHSRGKALNCPLKGYEATDALIDFIYTCEHELQHDIQKQRIENNEISYGTLCLIKDYLLIGLLPNFEGGENFYNNAHNDLFLETDANDHANEYIGNVVPIGGTLGRRVVNPNDPPGNQHILESVLLNRVDESNIGHHDNYSLSLGTNKIGVPPQEFNGNAEQIVSDFCDEILKKHPYLIESYPIFTLEYNKDGTRRSLSDINHLLEEAKINDGVIIDGQKINYNQIRIIYHRIVKYSRKLQKEISNSTQS